MHRATGPSGRSRTSHSTLRAIPAPVPTAAAERTSPVFTYRILERRSDASRSSDSWWPRGLHRRHHQRRYQRHRPSGARAPSHSRARAPRLTRQFITHVDSEAPGSAGGQLADLRPHHPEVNRKLRRMAGRCMRPPRAFYFRRWVSALHTGLWPGLGVGRGGGGSFRGRPVRSALRRFRRVRARRSPPDRTDVCRGAKRAGHGAEAFVCIGHGLGQPPRVLGETCAISPGVWRRDRGALHW